MEELKALRDGNYDGFMFMRSDDGNLAIKAFEFNEPGEKLPGSSMGDLYDIIVTPQDLSEMPDRFQAILTSPVDYLNRMFDDGFFGVLCKATTKSDKVMSENYEAMCEAIKETLKDDK
jgi:hypothetical protein